MRLIDADKLKDMLVSTSIKNDNYNVVTEQAIDRALTIDASPTTYGGWGKSYRSGYVPENGYVCTTCDCWAERPSKWCPNCGSMNKE